MEEPRLATLADFDQFMTLAAAYLVELRELGSEIKPTARSLGFWQDLFLKCIHPMVDETGLPTLYDNGVVLLLDEPACAFSLAFGLEFPFETDFGRTAFGHGTYIRPEHRGQGLSVVLRDAMRRELKLRGFDTILGGVHLSNDLGAKSLEHSNFVWYQLVGYERL